MAMTEEQKARRAESLAKARAAKKAKSEAVAAAANVAPTAAELSPERQAAQIEKDTYNMLQNDEKVMFIIPLEQGVESKAQYFIRSFNGVFLKIKRGERTMLPKHIVDFVEEREKIVRLSEENAAAFTSGYGKCLS